ncbi:MAG: TrmH family RNA methyltransferase [Bacteroidales bacterium]|nr:TrmH family RNA methyltransferase [Bacteroidales bacterium]
MANRKLLSVEMGRMTARQYEESVKFPVAVVLDNIRSAHNVGAALRSSDAFRIEKMCLCGISACPPSAEIHKSALGAESTVRWEHFSDTMDAVRALREDGWTIVSVEQTSESVKLEEFTTEKGRKYALIFGNEVEGVRDDVVSESDFTLEITQYGTKHSLNVSVTVGIVLWKLVSSLN